ncbi:MAG: FliA/WhiG family RNA polymerase sigma factor [Microthrixaceae bacterium]|nr:FliA/WhiG family RNA polymerase sigma factor [Microthrixaceae bacterium]
MEHADLVSYGMFGLIDAIDKFEPERGYKFETYAISRIKGAILDELRSIDWVPRSVRSKLRQIEKAIAKLEAVHHRPATDPELAAELEWSAEQLQTALNQISQVGLAALDEILAVPGERGESITLGDTIADTSAHGPMGAFEIAETRQLLGQAINALPEREKLVLTLYYYESMTLQEVGQVLGVTESRCVRSTPRRSCTCGADFRPQSGSRRPESDSSARRLWRGPRDPLRRCLG